MSCDQRQRLGQVLVQSQRPRDGARDLRHFHGVGQAAAEVVGAAGCVNTCVLPASRRKARA